MRVIIAPLEFKGTLTASQASAAVARGIASRLPGAQLVEKPMADGGPGTLDVLMSSLSMEVHDVTVGDPLGRPVTARWGSLNGETAIIETSQAIGLSLVRIEERDVESATSRGAGELIVSALESGATRLFIGIGGSATNDGGRGLLEALGVTFGDQSDHIDLAGLNPGLASAQIVVLSDVRSPLLGQNGATMVYATQKGAKLEALPGLEERMLQFADRAEAAFGRTARELPGSGAAGGLGFALSLLGGRILPGAEVIAGLLDLPKELKSASVLVTGEGSLDEQTASGKGVSFLVDLAQRSHVPAYGIFGQVSAPLLGLEQLISLAQQASSVRAAMDNAELEVEKAARKLAELFRAR